MSRFLLNTFLRFLTPLAFCVLLWFYLLRLRFNVYLSLGLSAFIAWKIAGQGKKNIARFFEEAEDTGISATFGRILKFTVPLLASVAVAQVSSRLDYAIGAFSPTITGLLAGGLTFFVAYGAVAVAPTILRTVYISGRKLLTPAQAKRNAARTTRQDQPKKPNTKDGLLFGGLIIPYQFATDHFLAVGTTGSGKTITIRLLLQGMDHYMRKHTGTHAVVYDSKGVYISYLANFATPTLPIIDLNPFREGAFAWDISLCTQDAVEILDLVSILIPEPKNPSETKFFTDAPRNLMQGIIRAFRDRVGNNWTFRDLILAMLSEDACRVLLSDTVQNRQLLASYIDGDERTSLNIRSTIQSLMMRYEPVATSWYRAAQAGRTIDLQQWSKSGSGYLVLGAQKTEDSAMESINRVLLNLLKRLWLEAPGTQPMPKHFLVMDELASAGKQTAISHLMNEGREKGVSVTLGFQDISDLYQTYGKDTAESMTAQASHKALLRMEGDVTPQWASRIAGEAEQFEYTYGSSQGDSYNGWSKSKSTTEQRTRKTVLMPSDFTTLPRVTKEAGLTGYYVSPIGGGVWQHHYSGQELFSEGGLLRPADDSKLSNRAVIPTLPEWAEDDLKRLKLPLDLFGEEEPDVIPPIPVVKPPANRQPDFEPPKPSRSNGLPKIRKRKPEDLSD